VVADHNPTGTGVRSTTAVDASDPSVIAPLAVLLRHARAEASRYQQARPFPHAVFDGLFENRRLLAVHDELPDRSVEGWRSYDTTHEWKYVFDKVHRLGPAARGLALELSSSEFVQFLETLTGIDGLLPDPHLRQAGYMVAPHGGFLAPHTDFTTLGDLPLVRRVNALVYLNEGWRYEWGGQLELWRSLDDGPEVEIVPTLGRLVVFSTPGAAHGHPKPVVAPDDRSRVCFSAYYYTADDSTVPIERQLVLWGDEGRRSVRLRHGISLLSPPLLTNTYHRRRQARRTVR